MCGRGAGPPWRCFRIPGTTARRAVATAATTLFKTLKRSAFRCNRRETEYALRVVATTETPVAVVGASGYTGEELVRLLLGHPYIDLVAATSRQLAGKSLAEAFPRFIGTRWGVN